MNDGMIILVLGFMFFIVIQSRDFVRKENHLIRIIQVLRKDLNNAHALIRYFRNNQNRVDERFSEKEASHAIPDITEARKWKRSWAIEVLRLDGEDFTYEELRTARKRAMKAHHPDVGGNPEKLRQAEEAFTFLSSCQDRDNTSFS